MNRLNRLHTLTPPEPATYPGLFFEKGWPNNEKTGTMWLKGMLEIPWVQVHTGESESGFGGRKRERELADLVVF